MKQKIIKCAGMIWVFLGKREEVTLAQLSKSIKEKSEVIFQALGWLAREDKIRYRETKRSIYVSLVDAEKEIFKSVAVMKETEFLGK